jgi:hypothetical protein
MKALLFLSMKSWKAKNYRTSDAGTRKQDELEANQIINARCNSAMEKKGSN